MSTHLKLLAAVALMIATSSIAEAAPLRLQGVFTASSSAPGSPAESAGDGSSMTVWNAGAFAEQWIQVDLGRPVPVARIRLQVHQVPSGDSTHELAVGLDPNNLQTVRTFSGFTRDGDWLEHTGDSASGHRLGNVRFVRITTKASPSWVGWREIEVLGAVEYLGFYASAADNHGCTGPCDFSAETATYGANLTWVLVDAADAATAPRRLVEKLDSATQHGDMKAVVSLESLLFHTEGSGDLAMSVRNVDWQERLDAILDAIGSGRAGKIAAFYPLDEPYLTAKGVYDKELVDASGAKAIATIVDDARVEQIRGWLDEIVVRIKARFPATPVAAILSWKELDALQRSSTWPRKFLLTSMLDWVGFDSYTNNTGDLTVYAEMLRSWLPWSGQRLIAVPMAFIAVQGNCDVPGAIPTSVDAQDAVVASLAWWKDRVTADGKYVAIVPFLWPNYQNRGECLVGARSLAAARVSVRRMSDILRP